jgi:hypothetical protein
MLWSTQFNEAKEVYDAYATDKNDHVQNAIGPDLAQRSFLASVDD